MRLLALGSGGKLGSLLKSAWPKTGPVTPIWHGGIGADLHFDICAEPRALSDSIGGCDAILLLAGVTTHRKDRPFSENISLAKTVLDAAETRPVLLASTAAVYGRTTGDLREDVLPNPESEYGISKWQMEQLASTYPRTSCLRIGNVAGADALLGTSKDSYRLEQFDDRSYPTRSYIGPALLAATLAKLAVLHASLPLRLNIACPEPVSMADLLQAAGKPWQAVPAPPSAIKVVHLDTSQLWARLPKPESTAAAIVADLQSVGRVL